MREFQDILPQRAIAEFESQCVSHYKKKLPLEDIVSCDEFGLIPYCHSMLISEVTGFFFQKLRVRRWDLFLSTYDRNEVRRFLPGSRQEYEVTFFKCSRQVLDKFVADLS